MFGRKVQGTVWVEKCGWGGREGGRRGDLSRKGSCAWRRLCVEEVGGGGVGCCKTTRVGLRAMYLERG